MPHASTFTRTCPAPGSGMSRSTNSQSPPALLTCAAFIFIRYSSSIESLLLKSGSPVLRPCHFQTESSEHLSRDVFVNFALIKNAHSPAGRVEHRQVENQHRIMRAMTTREDRPPSPPKILCLPCGARIHVRSYAIVNAGHHR